MTERRSWMKGLCLAALVLAMLSVFAYAEGTEMKDVPLSDLEKAEIDARLEALKPYLYKGEIAPRD